MATFIVYGWDFTDVEAHSRRMAARTEHLERMKSLKNEDKVLMAGAMMNEEQKMIGSTLVLDFETKHDLEKWLEKEPYILQKVWEKVEIKAFRVANL